MAELESPAEPKAVRDAAAERADERSRPASQRQARACRTRLSSLQRRTSGSVSSSRASNASSHSARTASLRCRRSSRTCPSLATHALVWRRRTVKREVIARTAVVKGLSELSPRQRQP